MSEAGTGGKSCMEGWKVDVPELFVGEVGLFVVATADRPAVAGKVLDAGQDAGFICQAGALEAMNLRFRHAGAEVRVLAGTLKNASPARVARNIDHGCEGPLDALRAGLAGSHRLSLFSGCGIPACGQRKGHGVHRAEAVNDVKAKEERNVQAAPLDRNMLKLIDTFCVGDEEEGP